MISWFPKIACFHIHNLYGYTWALHALSCCPAGAELLLAQPTPLLTCGVQGLIPMLHPDNTALVFAVEVIAGVVADPNGILAFRALPQPEVGL